MAAPSPQDFGLGQFQIPKEDQEWLSQPVKPDYVALMTPEQRDYYNRDIVKTPLEIEQLSHVSQGDPAWHKARGRVTASRLGAVAKHCPYSEGWDHLVQEMLYGEFKGNELTEHGNKTEPIARDLFIKQEWPLIQDKIRQARLAKKDSYVYGGVLHAVPALEVSREEEIFQVKVSGLHICPGKPWLACSSDGDINQNGLIEIKCPDPKHRKIYPLLPLYYYDQIQGNLYVRNRAYCYFLVYNNGFMTKELFHYDAHYCESYLIPMVNRFFFQFYLPAAVTKFKVLQQQNLALLVPLPPVPQPDETQQDQKTQIQIQTTETTTTTTTAQETRPQL